MVLILRYSLLLLFSVNYLFGQYLYTEDFLDISDWTVSSTGNNQWIDEMGSDSIFGVQGKAIIVSCNTCGQKPEYEIGLISNSTHITMNSAVNIPDNDYKIKFYYMSTTRNADTLSIEYSYDNNTWYNLSNLNTNYKWEVVSFPVTNLSGFTPGSDVYFRFVLSVGTNISPVKRSSCAIDNFVIVKNDWDITNNGQTIQIQDNTVLYIKNADYKANNSSQFRNRGTVILDNGSDFINDGNYFWIGGGDTIICKGDHNQVIHNPTGMIGTLFVDKTSSSHVVLVDSILEIKNKLHFVKGVLKPCARRVYVDLMNSNNPVASDDGYVDGAVRYYANITNRLFPTGNKGYYRPIVLENGPTPYIIRYIRENGGVSVTHDNYSLDSVSTQGFWVVRRESLGSTIGKIRLSFKGATEDHVYDAESTRVAISESILGTYYTNEQWLTTHTGTFANGTVEVNEAVEAPLYFLRVGYAKNGRISLKAMLQGALMSSTKVIWREVDFIDNLLFTPDIWIFPPGNMYFKSLVFSDPNQSLTTSKPWNHAFKGLVCVNNSNHKNSWVTTGSGENTAKMNFNVPILSVSEQYYVEVNYLYDGNTNNKLHLLYSVDDGSSWYPIELIPTNQKWHLFSLELNGTNFPGFVLGTTPIRFGFKVEWDSPNITDPNVPSPLIGDIRIIKKTTEPEQMTTYLKSSYILDSLVGIESIPSFLKKIVPYDAVDLITVQIRDNNTSSYTVIDEQKAWLMRDGTIKSLGFNNHIRFVHTNSGTGYMVVKHRNHLPVMSANSITFNPTTESTVIDFTDILNINNGTAYKYASGPDKYALYMGNATEDFLNGDYYETNATDFFIVSTKNNETPDRAYHREDLNLDGYVNGVDFDLVQIGNNNLYFTSVPEP